MKLIIAALSIFLVGSAPAMACGHGAVPSSRIEPVLPSIWLDSLKFGFLIGRDYDGAGFGMEMGARFRTIQNYPALRATAGDWLSDYRTLDQLADEMMSAAPIARSLTTWCKLLERPPHPNEPVDERMARAELRAIAQHLDGLITRSNSIEFRLARHADRIGAAASQYARAGYNPIPQADIGPDPAAVAMGFDTILGRWRAINADLNFARRSLPLEPDSDEATLHGLAVTAATMWQVAEAVEALAVNLPPPDSYDQLASGRYLQDACASAEGRAMQLRNSYQPDSALIFQPEQVFVAPPTGDGRQSRWTMRRHENGYWLILNDASGNRSLEVVSGSDAPFPLRLTEIRGEIRPSQLWRCYPAEVPDHFRLANATLGETRSLDTYSNEPTAVMLPTGGYSGQNWRALP